MIEQLIQIIGALLVLAGFLAAQADRVDRRSGSYLVANFFGSGAMAATAVATGDWGFVLLEGVWALVSMWGIAQKWGPEWLAHSAEGMGDGA